MAITAQTISWIDDPALQWAGKRVLCRLDLDIALPQGQVPDAVDVLPLVPTIQFLLQRGARVIVAGHCGDPKAKVRQYLSLLPLAECLQERLQNEIVFVHDCVGMGVRCLVNNLRDGQLLVLENLCFYRGEYTKHNAFTKELASLADVYVNDAFACSHLPYASLSSVPQAMPCGLGGLKLRQDLQALEQLHNDPPRPVVAVLGNEKEDSVNLLRAVERILPQIDTLCIGGCLAHLFARAGVDKGKRTDDTQVSGGSVVPDRETIAALRLLRRAETAGVTVQLPQDCVVVSKDHIESMDESTSHVVPWSQVTDDTAIVDMGPATQEGLAQTMRTAGTILFMGSLGAWRQPRFADGTRLVVKSLTQRARPCVVVGAEATQACRALGEKTASLHFVAGTLAALQWLGHEELPGLQGLRPLAPKASDDSKHFGRT